MNFDSRHHPYVVILGKDTHKELNYVKNLLDVTEWHAWCGSRDVKTRYSSLGMHVHGHDAEGATALNAMTAEREEKVRTGDDVPTIGLVIEGRVDPYDKMWRDVITNGRHYNCVIVHCVQYMTNIPAGARLNIDHMLVSKSMAKRVCPVENRAILYDMSRSEPVVTFPEIH